VRTSDVAHLLLVGARPEVVGKLVGLPLCVTLLHFPGSLTASMRETAASALPVDIADPRAVLEVARAVHRRRPVDGVLSLTEPGLVPASVAAEALGVRGNPAAAVRAAQDKALTRRCLQDVGLDPTRYRSCTGPADAADFLRSHPGGIVLKPVDGAGSAGVARVMHDGELSGGWGWAAAAAGGRPVLAEELLSGPEYSVETLSTDGLHRVLAVTRKITTGPPHYVETGHDLPAELAVEDRKRIVDLVLAALDATGQQWGPCHTEVVLTAHRAALVEINPRVGGDRIWEMVDIATGVDLCSASAFALAAGMSPELGTRVGGAAVRFLTAAPGVLDAIDGTDEALAVPGVIRLGDLPAVGATVRPLRSSSDRVGYVLSCAPPSPVVPAAATEAASRIRLRTAAPASGDRVRTPGSPWTC
jgi:biotin carboxylase